MSILSDFTPKFLPFSLVGDVFIDTGMADYAMAGDGCSLRNAAKQPFKELHGIEVSPYNFSAACAWWIGEKANTDRRALTICLDGDRAMTFHRGSSPDVLLTILDPAKRTTIWCDAHWQGKFGRPDEMDNRHGQCPLLQELPAIMAVPWAVNPIILVDDMPQLGGSESWWNKYGHNFDRSQWPNVGQILDLLPDVNALIRDGIMYCWWE